MFTKAQRKQTRLRLAISGPAGSGKTWGSLMIAKGLGGRIAVIDTERGSASLYADLVEFDTLQMAPPYTPEKFIEGIRSAEKEGYGVIIIDSISHEWDGAGGCLEANDKLAAVRYKGNSWAAWSETTPRHQAFVDTILQSTSHVIATMRSKTETVQDADKKVKKVGMKAVQRDGMEYEYTVVWELEHSNHWAVATKDRTRLFAEPHQITPETGKRLLSWLDSMDPADLPPIPKTTPVQTSAPPTDRKSKSDFFRLSAAALRNWKTEDDLRAAFKTVLDNKKKFTPDEFQELVGIKDEEKQKVAATEAPKPPPETEPPETEPPIEAEYQVLDDPAFGAGAEPEPDHGDAYEPPAPGPISRSQVDALFALLGAKGLTWPAARSRAEEWLGSQVAITNLTELDGVAALQLEAWLHKLTAKGQPKKRGNV